jgi:phosphotransacetylase
MNPTEALHYGGGAGALLLGLAALARALPMLIKQAITAWRSVQAKRADAERIAAQTDHLEEQGKIASLEALSGAFAALERRVEEYRRDLEKARGEAARLRRYVEKLVRMMERRGMTPPEMEAAESGEWEG